ncbi:MAG: GNAT family N-acetyltransferase [Fimbriimonadaceae bacterium]|nr:MAG: GNAT family N-acetyltransferase [Fimbriimonadaceae bacterium]
MRAEDRIPTAIEVFACAFARIRSRTYPSSATRVNDVYVIHDDPYRLKARASELVTQNPNPARHIEVGRQMECPRWFSCFIATPEQEPEALPRFKEEGFKRIRIEPLFLIDPRQANLSDHSRVQRVQDAELAEACRIARRGRQAIRLEELEPDDSPVRLYTVFEAGRVLAWGSSFKVGELGHWVSDVFVVPDARRQGLGKAIMSAILADDARLGSPMSVLLASNAGSQLYPHLGYQSPARLHMFKPPGYTAKPRELCL